MSLRFKWKAYKELMAHYRDVFGYHWKRRDALDGEFFSENEAEFLPSALALQEKPVSRTARITSRLLVLLVLATLAWAILGKIDIIVNATGKIIAAGRTQTITSVEMTAVKAIHVHEGQSVKAGDVLIELDSSTSDSEYNKALSDEQLSNLQIARAQAMAKAVDTLSAPVIANGTNLPATLLQSEQRHLEEQYKDFRAKLAKLDGDVARYSQALIIASQRAKDYKALSINHDVSEHAYLEKEQVRNDLLAQQTEARNQRAAFLAQTRKESQDAIADATKTTLSRKQDALRADARNKLLKITSPIDGTVQQLNVFTVGAAIPAAQPLMQIVPNNAKLEAETFIENKDVGFVHEGQTAQAKIEAFDYTKYGTIPAHISHVSRDAVQDEKKGLVYAVRIALDKSSLQNDEKTLPLSPGMIVNVEIKTGSRRIIEYLLSPLMQHGHEAMNER